MAPEATTPRYRTTFVRLLGFLSPYKRSTGVSVVLAIGTQAAALVAVLLTRSIVGVLGDDHLGRLPLAASARCSGSASRAR